MTTRERRPQEQTVPAASTEPETEHTTEARDAGDAFLRAADTALERALSGSPEEFLRQNRQLGGQ